MAIFAANWKGIFETISRKDTRESNNDYAHNILNVSTTLAININLFSVYIYVNILSEKQNTSYQEEMA